MSDVVYFSRSTNGFYVEGIHDHIPEDAVAISAQEHSALISEQSNGKVITSDADGFPVAKVPPQPSDEELRLECKARAKTLINLTDWSMLPDVQISNRSEFETYRAELRLLILDPAPNPSWPVEPQPAWIA